MISVEVDVTLEVTDYNFDEVDTVEVTPDEAEWKPNDVVFDYNEMIDTITEIPQG